METKPIGLYVHIPFCLRKCNYCDFCSEAASIEKQRKYIDNLILEIESYKTPKKQKINSIFFGGGTPSILKGEDFLKIVEKINESFDLLEPYEFTVEVNPATLTEEKVDAFKKAKVNRISIGMQSIHENELKILGRIHTYEDFEHTFNMLREAGFKNISIDLMYGIPHQTVTSFSETIDRVTALSPEHISAYALIIEEGTPFYEMREGLPLPTEDEECDMYDILCARLGTAGYSHYEISNYAKDGKMSMHNLKYWHDEEYIGIGLSAHSYYGGKRFYNTDSFEEYFENFGAKYRKEENEKVGIDKFEYAMLALRLSDGFSLSEYENLFGEKFAIGKESLINAYVDNGFLKIENGRIFLTDKGFYISNTILSELL